MLKEMKRKKRRKSSLLAILDSLLPIEIWLLLKALLNSNSLLKFRNNHLLTLR
jgi:hypothetical protein